MLSTATSNKRKVEDILFLQVNKRVNHHRAAQYRCCAAFGRSDIKHENIVTRPSRRSQSAEGHANVTTTERYDKRRLNLEKSAAYAVDFELEKKKA